MTKAFHAHPVGTLKTRDGAWKVPSPDSEDITSGYGQGCRWPS
jgi:hypothetical protein